MVKCDVCGRRLKFRETRNKIYSLDGTILLCCPECAEEKIEDLRNSKMDKNFNPEEFPFPNKPQMKLINELNKQGIPIVQYNVSHSMGEYHINFQIIGNEYNNKVNDIIKAYNEPNQKVIHVKSVAMKEYGSAITEYFIVIKQIVEEKKKSRGWFV